MLEPISNIIYRSGDPSESVYLVIKGRILLAVKDKNESSQSVIFSNNDFFGAKELFSKISRCSEAVSLTNSLLIELSRDEIEYLIEKDGNIALNVQKGNFDFNFRGNIKNELLKKYFDDSDLDGKSTHKSKKNSSDIN